MKRKFIFSRKINGPFFDISKIAYYTLVTTEEKLESLMFLKLFKLKTLNSADASCKCICMAESQQVPERQQDASPAF